MTSRYRLRPGTHSLRITASDVERDGHQLTSELSALVTEAAKARLAGKTERAELLAKRATWRLLEAQRKARQS